MPLSIFRRPLKRQLLGPLPLLWTIGLGYLALGPSLHASERPLMVYGWPVSESDPEKMILNQDAIMGTYVCPALTRLNLQASNSELVLLDKLQDGKTQWTMNLKPGLKWWSGKDLESKDLAAFLKSELPVLVKKIGNDRWELPGFRVEDSGSTVKVVWDKAPQFGPFILNRSSFYRRIESGVECVGSLKPQKNESGLGFAGTLGGKDRLLVLNQELPLPPAKPGESFVSFRFGNEMHLNPLSGKSKRS